MEGLSRDHNQNEHLPSALREDHRAIGPGVFSATGNPDAVRRWRGPTDACGEDGFGLGSREQEPPMGGGVSLPPLAVGEPD